MEIAKANIENTNEILNIYKSLVGTPGCAWTEFYPGLEELQSDLENEALYIIKDENKIVGIASAFKDEELIDLNCWNKEIKNPYELARIGVIKEYQNKGIAKQLIKYIENDVLSKGCDGIHFIVSKTNPAALNLYNSLNYVCCGETIMYELDWFCYEKKLTN